MATNKRAGNHSAQQNDNLVPYAPIIGTATDSGIGRAYNNGSASVTFSANGPYNATSYTVTSSPGGYTASGSTSPILVTGLQSATAYTFTVTATNEYGTSAASSASNQITATTVPGVPGSVTASSPGAGYDTISWTAPNNGGLAITNYHVAGNDGTAADTTALTVNISQGMGETQAYTVYATNANGNSATSVLTANVTTTFSFVPFGAFGFSPFGAFGFSPFSAFGFSPFAAFGFSPYAPRCIAANTLIATVGSEDSVVWIKAKDLTVGTKVFSPTWDEFDGTPSPYESRIEYDSLSNKTVGIGTVSFISGKTVNKSIVFNEDNGKHFSSTQPVLARKSGQKNAWEFTGDLIEGDILWEYDFETKQFLETVIDKVSVLENDQEVFQISVDGIDTFIAGDIISHNK